MIFRQASSVTERAQRIRLLLLDVDGVLTDGSIIYNDDGVETKVFNVKDGLGIRLLRLGAIEVGIATGRTSDALIHRCRNLGITHVFQGLKDKTLILDNVCKQADVREDEIAFMGDDLLDIAIMKRVGLAVAVADAHPEVMHVSHVICAAKGGHGAVREIAEYLLAVQGKWADILKRFTG